MIEYLFIHECICTDIMAEIRYIIHVGLIFYLLLHFKYITNMTTFYLYFDLLNYLESCKVMFFWVKPYDLDDVTNMS